MKEKHRQCAIRGRRISCSEVKQSVQTCGRQLTLPSSLSTSVTTNELTFNQKAFLNLWHYALRMPERKWVQMNGRRVSRNFGVYREADASLKTGSKILLILACLSAAVIIICFTTLSIIKIRGRNRLESLLNQKEENIDTTTEKAELKIHRKIDLEWTTSLPETEHNRIRFPDEKEIDRLSPRQGKVLERLNRQKAGNQFFPQYSEHYPQLVLRNPDIKIQKMPTVKFTGVYIRETDDESDEDYPSKPINGHAYASDPFKQYKPSHPSEINHLATFPSDADTGHRFSNKIVKPTKMPMDSATLSSQIQLTQAIFHPYEPVPSSSTLRPEKKKKPLKIMLDIYPVTPSIDHSSIYSNGRKIQPPYGQSIPPQNNRMIVHLNLYPKKRKQPREQQPIFTSLVPGGPDNFEDRIDGDYEDDENSDYHGTIQLDESSQIEEPEDIENTTIIPLNDSTPDYIFEQEDLSSEEEDETKNIKIDKIIDESPSHLH